MTFHSWFKHKPLWFKGGILGILLCVILTVFYITIYNALLIQFFPDGMLPFSSLLLPLITGHFFIFGAHFIAEGYVAPVLGCVFGDCFDRADWMTLIGSGIILLFLYFGIGAGIGWLMHKRKKKIIS